MREPGESFKILFFSIPHEITIARGTVRTFLDLKMELQKITYLEVNNQKLLLNRKIITDDDSTNMADLGIAETDKLRLLTKNSQTLAEYEYSRRNEGFNQQSGQLQTQSNKSSEQGQSLTKTSVDVSNLTEAHLSLIARNLFGKKTWQGRDEKLLGERGFLTFVLSKIGKRHKVFGHIFGRKQRQKQICRLLLEKEFSEAEAQRKVQTYDKAVCGKLVNMGYGEEKVKQCLERAQNNIFQALEILYNGKDSGEFQMQDRAVDELDEYCLVFRWLMCKANVKIRVRLSLSQNNFQIYLNSLRYRCVGLYQILSRRRGFAMRLLQRDLPDGWMTAEQAINE